MGRRVRTMRKKERGKVEKNERSLLNDYIAKTIREYSLRAQNEESSAENTVH